MVLSSPSVVFLDIGLGGTPLGRLSFALAPPSLLPHTRENLRQLFTSERTALDSRLSYKGCSFAWSPSYVEGPQYKFAHVCDGRGLRAHPKTDDGAVLAACAVKVFGGTTYYGLELDLKDGAAEGTIDGRRTNAGTVLTVPVVGPGRGKTRFSIVRVEASPPAWRERLLINSAVMGVLVSGAEVVQMMARASSPPVILATGELPEDSAVELLDAVSRLRGGFAPAPQVHNSVKRGVSSSPMVLCKLRRRATAYLTAWPRGSRVTCSRCAGIWLHEVDAPSPDGPVIDSMADPRNEPPPISRSWDPDLPVEKVVPNLLRALQSNDEPTLNAGLRTFWDWTHELYRGRPVNGHGDFSLFAKRAARSELAALLQSSGWQAEPYSPVGDGSKYGTHVVTIFPCGDLDGQGARRYLFQLRREMRPPYNGAWAVWGVIVSDANGELQDLSGGF
eukprot:scaffold154784_cov32-Tisochrysis_lutea.AAC.2